jgi:hypothetical protein
MANWFNTVDISTEWLTVNAGDITPGELATIIAEKLERLPKYPDETLNTMLSGLIEEFRYSKSPDYDEFDGILNELYDFGDIKFTENGIKYSALWVKTFF